MRGDLGIPFCTAALTQCAKQISYRPTTVHEGHELRHQAAAGHTFWIPCSDEDVTPDKLASSNDRFALYLNASGETWHGVIQERARNIWVRACCSHKPCLTGGALGFYRVDALNELCGRLPMLQHHAL